MWNILNSVAKVKSESKIHHTECHISVTARGTSVCVKQPLSIGNLCVLPHVGKMLIHCSTIREVMTHTCHQLAEARVCGRLIIKDNKEWSHKVTHPLHITCIQVFPHIPDR